MGVEVYSASSVIYESYPTQQFSEDGPNPKRLGPRCPTTKQRASSAGLDRADLPWVFARKVGRMCALESIRSDVQEML